MKREEAISLLKEIMGNCASFHLAQTVTVSKNQEGEGWIVRAKWVCPESEKVGLNNIKQNHIVEITETADYTIFH